MSKTATDPTAFLKALFLANAREALELTRAGFPGLTDADQERAIAEFLAERMVELIVTPELIESTGCTLH